MYTETLNITRMLILLFFSLVCLLQAFILHCHLDLMGVIMTL